MNLCLRFQDSIAVKRVVSDVMTPCSLVRVWLPTIRRTFRLEEGNGKCCSEKWINTYQTRRRNYYYYYYYYYYWYSALGPVWAETRVQSGD